VEWPLVKFPRVIVRILMDILFVDCAQRWKCASSVNNKTTVRGTFWRSSQRKVVRVSQSISLRSCAITIL
jgi:hypothetical protein